MKNFIYKKRGKKTNVDIKNVFTINKIAFLLSLIIKNTNNSKAWFGLRLIAKDSAMIEVLLICKLKTLNKKTNTKK